MDLQRSAQTNTRGSNRRLNPLHAVSETARSRRNPASNRRDVETLPVGQRLALSSGAWGQGPRHGAPGRKSGSPDDDLVGGIGRTLARSIDRLGPPIPGAT